MNLTLHQAAYLSRHEDELKRRIKDLEATGMNAGEALKKAASDMLTEHRNNRNKKMIDGDGNAILRNDDSVRLKKEQ